MLHFAVTGALLGGVVSCASNEAPKGETKAKQGEAKVEAKQGEPKQPEPEPEMKFAPNPGPEELPKPQPPEIAPTTAVEPDSPPKEPVGIGANQGPVAQPKKPEPIVEKHVNEGPEPEPPKVPPIKVNPAREP